MIEKLLEHQSLQKWTSKIKYFGLNNSSNQAKLCGIDLYKDYVRLKAYIELFDLPEENVLLDFFPKTVVTDLQHLYQYKDPTLGFSFGLGFKIDNNGKEENYLHLKLLPTCQDHLRDTFPKLKSMLINFKILGINSHVLHKGISYECSTSNINKKIYFYIKDPLQIKKILLSKKLYQNLDISYIDHLEMYSCLHTNKINIVNNNDYYIIRQDAWLVVPEHYKQNLKRCESLFKSDLLYTGFREDNIFSAYYSLSNIKDNIFGL